jgi:hypothetical protein
MPFDGVGLGVPCQRVPSGADEWLDWLPLCFLIAATAVMGLAAATALGSWAYQYLHTPAPASYLMPNSPIR